MPILNKTIRYVPLSTTDSQDNESEKVTARDVDLSFNRRTSRHRFIWLVHLFLAAFWVLGFAALISHGSLIPRHSYADRTSPLRKTLTYNTTKFSTGFGNDRTIYQGSPNDANTAAWNRLTNTGIVAVTADEHRRLHDDSAVFETKDGKSTYLGAVEVFHQLHCLDMLRLEVYGTLTEWLHEHHSSKDKLEHLDHCIDYLRQSLMCRPSIEILPFGVDEATISFKPRFDGAHTCADFEAVRDWAVEHQAGNMTPQ